MIAIAALPLPLDDDNPHQAEPAVSLLRQAIVMYQGGHVEDPIVRAQADVLLQLITPRRKEIVRGRAQIEPPLLQLAFNFDPELVVNINVRVKGKRYVAAAVSPLFTDGRW